MRGRRYRHLRRTGIAVLAMVAVLLGILMGAAHLMRRESTRRAAARWLAVHAGRLTGAEVHTEDLEWGMLPPRIVLRGVRVETADAAVRADLLSVELAGLHVVRRTVELGTVVVDGLHVRFRPRARRRPRRTSWVKVSVRHLAVRNVEIEGTDLPGGLAVGLHGVRAAWTEADGPPRGLVHVSRLEVAVPGLRPIQAFAEARLAGGQGLDIRQWRLRTAEVDLTGTGRVSGSRLVLRGAGGIDLAKLDRTLRVGRVLRGDCNLTFRVDTGSPELVAAWIRSPRITAAGFPIDRLTARVVVSRAGIDAVLERGSIAGGSIRGSYRLGSLSAPFPHRVALSGERVRLAAFLSLLHVPDVGFASAAGVRAELSWSGTHVAAGSGEAAIVLSPAPGRLPVAGSLAIRLAQEGLLRFSSGPLRVGRSTVRLEGPLVLGSWRPSWSILAAPVDIHELIPVVNGFLGSTVLPLELAGSGELHLTLAGPWNDLRTELRLEATPLLYPPVVLDRALVSAAVTGAGVRIGEGAFRIGDGSGQVGGGITFGAGSEGAVLDLAMRGLGLSMASVAGWLGERVSVRGTAGFSGTLRGAVASPRGSWAVGIGGLDVQGIDLGDASVNIELANGVFEARGLECTAGLRGTGRWEVAAQALSGRVQAAELSTGVLPPAAAALFGPTVSGDVAMAVSPATGLSATASIRSPTVDASGTLEAGGLTLAASIGGAAHLTATLASDGHGGFAGTGEADVRSLKALLDLAAPGAALDISGTAHARSRITLPASGAPTVEGVLDRLALTLSGDPVQLVEPAHFSYSGEGFRMRGPWLRLADGKELYTRWSVDASGGLSGNVSGAFDAALLRILAPAWEPAGRVEGVLELMGTVRAPAVDGIAELSHGSFRLPESSFLFSNLDGTVVLSGEGIDLDGVRFRLLGGAGLAAGRIGLTERGWRLDLHGSADHVRFPLFAGLEPRLSGSWSLAGTGDGLILGGDLTVDRALLARDDPVDSILLEWFGGPEKSPGPDLPELDLWVTADHTIEARSPLVRFVASTNLHITGSPAHPGLVGRLELLEGGLFTFQGVEYELDRAVVTFTDPTSIQPRIDLQARTWVDTYQITVNLTGSGSRVIPAFSSDPPLPEEQILPLLAMGSGGEQGGGVGLASSLLSREINAVLSKRARTLLPVDQVRVDPFTASASGSPAARVTVVKQLNPSWTIVLQTNLSSNRQEVVRSRWQLSRRLFLEATREVDGRWALDLKLRRRY